MHHPRRARPTSLDPVQAHGESRSHRNGNGGHSKGHRKKKHHNQQPWTHDAAAAHSLGIAAGRPFVAPRNLGPNSKSRQDGPLSLDCQPMRVKPKPAVSGYLPPRRPPVVGRDGWNGKSYDKIPDPMAGAWDELQTGQVSSSSLFCSSVVSFLFCELLFLASFPTLLCPCTNYMCTFLLLL